MTKLTASKVKSITKPGRHSDGGGLYLVVSPAGTKSWLYRFQLNKRRRDMGLGSVDIVSLKDARLARNEAQKLVASGIDPIEAQKARRGGNASITFGDAIDTYIKAHSQSWKNAKHRQQWENTMETYVKPVVGHRPANALTTDDVLAILTPIWSAKHETASRVRGRIENVFDYCRARGWVTGANPARMKGHLDKLLPKVSRVKKVRHHPAMPYQDAPDFFRSLYDDPGRSISASALLFAILTACRTGEVIAAKRSEIDTRENVWSIPGERMKNGKPHRVPLSPAATKILEQLPRISGRKSDYLFPSPKAREGHISNMAMLKVLKCRGVGQFTVHGFRSTFRDWVSETTAYPNEVAEMALAHTIKDDTESAYRRGDMLDRRRPMMADWAGYLTGEVDLERKAKQLTAGMSPDQIRALADALAKSA